MTVKEDLRQRVDQLPDVEDVPSDVQETVDNLHRLLEALDGKLRDLQRVVIARRLREAPPDDEPEADEERIAVAEAVEALRRGDVVSDEELRRELGL